MKELVEDSLKIGYFDDVGKGSQFYKEKGGGIIIKKRTKKLVQMIVPGSEKNNKRYNVAFSMVGGDEILNVECNCRDFKDYLDCKHCVAAALFIIDNGHLASFPNTTPVKKHPIKHKEIKPLSGYPDHLNSQLGYLFDFAEKKHIRFSLQLLMVKEENGKNSFLKFTSLKKQFPDYKNLLPNDQKLIFEELSFEFIRYNILARGNAQLSAFLASESTLSERQIETVQKYYHSKLKELWPFLLQQQNVFMLPRGKAFNASNLQQLQLGASFPTLSFKVTSDKKSIKIQPIITIEGKKITQFSSYGQSFLFIEYANKFYFFEDYAHVELMHKFEKGILEYPIKEQFNVMLKIVPSLQEHYEVEIDPKLLFERRKGEPESQVMVAEYLNQFMMLIPQFMYEDTLVEYDDESAIVVNNHEGAYLIERNKEAEKEFHEKLRSFHPSFSKQLLKPFYYIPFTDVMKSQWFLKTIRTLQDQNFTIKGMENLKKFRYNTSTPSWKMKTTSGTDWFDLKILVTFGSQKVLLRDIQKAIKSDQKIVVLGDGSLGALPEEWLERFGMLMKMGEEKDGTLRVNKMHFILVSELHSLIQEKDLLKELEDKKRQLENIENFESKPLSEKITAQLRPYQHSGFQWMQALDEIGWGGCLADDMGLGKTLQVISFLQFVKEKYPGAINLVVVPTSLIYNWESELQKFAPSLKYHIHYGSNRRIEEEHLEDNDIIITSYGNMRNDIEEFQKYQFQYAILDESQGIKNPGALVTRAAQLLRAKNRLILSGTPIQNNTFDLYAQMHFLNPGFLGNKEFFKAQFADPIDKFGSQEKAQQLRKMIYPFILRRTKEKVAPDLPDKTETILWCEMGPEQRKVYDDYKNYYRHHLLNKIDESGMNKSAIYVLEGLTRLRQI
ncbi:MAG: SNF2-related protein, partial [Ginsengibacter sp.]